MILRLKSLYHYSKEAFIFRLDSKMVKIIQLKYARMDFLLEFLVTQIRWNKATRYSTDKHVHTI